MRDPTKRQREVLQFIINFYEEMGYCPELREIGEYMGIASTNGVSDHLQSLERKGYIRTTPYSPRAIRVLRLPNGDPCALRFERCFGPRKEQEHDQGSAEHQGHEGLSDRLG